MRDSIYQSGMKFISFLLPVLLGGCIFVNVNDPDDELGRFAVSWTLLADANPQCPPGGMIEIAAKPLVGATQTNRFACTQGSAETTGLQPGNYEVSLTIQTSAGSTFAESDPVQSTIAAGTPTTLSFDILLDKGFLITQWTLTQGGGAVNCSDVGAANVEILATDSGAAGFTDTFSCTDSFGKSQGLDFDTYSVVVNLLDGSDALIVATTPADFDVTFGNETVDVGAIEFAVP